MIKKGDKVLVKSVVFTKDRCYPAGYQWPAKVVHVPPAPKDRRRNHIRALMRVDYKEPFKALVIGRSTRISCVHHWTYANGEGFITDDTTHKVIMVTPLNTQRYLRPYACLEEDLEPYVNLD
jgi:hypothetical protein